MEFLTPQQVEEFKNIFNQLDSKGTGKIGTHELGIVFRCFDLYPTEAEIQDIMNEVDTDGNGNGNSFYYDI